MWTCGVYVYQLGFRLYKESMLRQIQNLLLSRNDKDLKSTSTCIIDRIIFYQHV